jgi:hypothetical protein
MVVADLFHPLDVLAKFIELKLAEREGFEPTVGL